MRVRSLRDCLRSCYETFRGAPSLMSVLGLPILECLNARRAMADSNESRVTDGRTTRGAKLASQGKP
jgi:hypothetical protein